MRNDFDFYAHRVNIPWYTKRPVEVSPALFRRVSGFLFDEYAKENISESILLERFNMLYAIRQAFLTVE